MSKSYKVLKTVVHMGPKIRMVRHSTAFDLTATVR